MNLSIEEAWFRYPNGALAVDRVTLPIASGEQVAWIGANGAGKSTLARLVNGLLHPQQGRVLVGDWDTQAHKVNELARRVGYVFQNPDEQLFARTVREEVAFGPRNLGRSRAEVGQAVETALKAVGLFDSAEANPYDLHPARRRELCLASVLAMDPSILILDEPSTGQDAAGLERIGEVLRDLKSRGRTVILITHDMEFCADHADRVVVFFQGRVLLDGPAGDIFARSEVLDQAQVDPPQLTRLAGALRIEGTILDEEGFLSAWHASRRTDAPT